MRHAKIKQFVFLLGLLLPTIWGGAHTTNLFDGYSPIAVKEKTVQGAPKGSTITASISGHTLMVSFSQNIGQVSVEITTDTGVTVDCLSAMTPTGFQSYFPMRATTLSPSRSPMETSTMASLP